MLREPRGAAARGGPSCGERETGSPQVYLRGSPAGRTLRFLTALPLQDGTGRWSAGSEASRGQRPLAGRGRPRPRLQSRAFPARGSCAERARIQAPGERGAPRSAGLSRRIPKSDSRWRKRRGQRKQVLRLLSTIIISGISSGTERASLDCAGPGR